MARFKIFNKNDVLKNSKKNVAKSNVRKTIICSFLAFALIIGMSPDFSFATQKLINPDLNNKNVDSQKVSTSICDEGITLLKNDTLSTNEKSLPLTNPAINIFGGGGCDKGWYYQGNGSGAGSHAYRVSLYDAFRESGFDINEDLAKAYNTSGFSNECPVAENPDINFIIHQTTTEFVNSQIEHAKSFSDQAIFVLSRYGGEGNELPKFQCKDTLKGKDEKGQAIWDRTWDKDKIYSELTNEEAEQLKLVCNNFNNVIILFNCCNPMQMGFLNDTKNFPNIKSALYMPMGGSWGPYSVPNILSGEINPSGHMADLVAYDFKTAPSFANSSYNYTDDGKAFDRRYEDKRFSDHKGDYIHYTAYEENIYIGYYWYETADAEGYWKSLNTSYDKVVQFPFGYGLSYTNFEWSNVKYLDENNKPLTSLSKNQNIKVSVDVKNTGSVAGKDVVQLYVQKPYYSGGIEKPAVQLAAFTKTDLIEPGKSQTVYMQLNLQDIADYDCYDKNNNGHMGYELDAGDYIFSLRTNSHVVKNQKLNKKFSINQYIYETDKDTHTKIENLFTTYTNQKSHASSTNSDKHPDNGRCGSIDGSDFNAGKGIGATYLTRQNFKGTFPTKYLPSPELGDDFLKTWKVNKPWMEKIDKLPKQGQAVELTLDDLIGKSYEDPAWDKVMNSLTYEEMFKLCQAKGGFGSPAIEKIRKPETVDKDGPCGFGSGARGSKIAPANYPSDSMIGCTWNYKLSKAFGEALGFEAKHKLGRIDGNYGPGLNIHRTPLGGRNFEYYSEDALLSGTLCSWQISAALDEGLYCYVKHIALNDCDTGRNGKYNFATEQTFRQIYAKAFEIISKGAKVCDNNDKGKIIQAHKANAFMASVDRIGTTRVTGSYNFLTQMLRNEWGFRGSIVTDYYQSGDVNDVDEGIRSGNDLMLNGANNCEYDDSTSNTAKFYVRQAAKNILYTYINTKSYTVIK